MLSESPPARSGCAKWLSITLIALALIGSITLLMSLDKLQRLANSFRGDTVITDSFRENLIKVTGTQGDILEVATMEMDETFTRHNARTVGWNLLYMGTTVSEIRATAVFRYHIKLSDAWNVVLSADRKTCTVTAPLIRPSLPPAIRTNNMEKKSAAGWARFNAAQNLSELEKSITPSLASASTAPSPIASASATNSNVKLGMRLPKSASWRSSNTA